MDDSDMGDGPLGIDVGLFEVLFTEWKGLGGTEWLLENEERLSFASDLLVCPA